MEGISELPEGIIHRIFSFLTLEEGMQASLLSKAWMNAWRTRPNLDFDLLQYIRMRYDDYVDFDGDPSIELEQSFYKYVKQTLLRYRESKIGIQTFKLDLRTSGGSPCREWLETVVENGVKKLELYISSPCPQIILEAKSLEDFSFHGRYLDLQVPQRIMCRNLKRLHLSCVRLDDVKFQKIISSCKMIEFLSLYHCDCAENYKVIGLPKLKSFTICTYQHVRVEVEAPNLKSFTCINRSSDSIVWLTLNAPLLKSLKLESRVYFTDSILFHFGYKFPCLEDLTIDFSESFERIDISSQTVKNLELYSSNVLKELQVDAPSIGRFKYGGRIIPCVSFTSASTHWVSEITVWDDENTDNFWFMLKGFLAKLRQSEIYLNIDFTWGLTFNLEEENRRGLMFPIPQVQELSITGGFALDFENTLDGVFWTCRPKTIKQIGYWEFTDFLYCMLMDRRKKNEEVDDSQPIKFWEEDLKLVKLETFMKKPADSAWEPYTLDWKTFSETPEIRYSKLCLFDLEWGSF